MSFFQVDDQLQVNAKPRALVERALLGDLAGVAAMGLWTMAGSLAQAQMSDGLVKHTDCVRILLNPTIASQLADLLVDVGLWHAAGHGCERCGPVPVDHYRFHDWGEWYEPAEATKVKRRKGKELKDRQLVEQVWARDAVDHARSVGACRYCAKLVRRKDTRSGQDQPTLDHVDPTKAVGVRNVVLACKACNQRKGARTPEQAGMVLLDPPHRRRGDADGGDGPVSPAPADAEMAAPSPATRGHEQADAGEVVGSPDRTDAGPATASPALADSEDVEPDHVRPRADHRGPAPGPARQEARESAAAVDPPDPPGAGPRADQVQTTVEPAVLGRARDRARAGQGQGGDGLPPGLVQGQPRRRRRRGRGSARHQPGREGLDAGEPPPGVVAPARWGSPWHGWTGPPSDVTETTCETHGLEQPCWKCERETR